MLVLTRRWCCRWKASVRQTGGGRSLSRSSLQASRCRSASGDASHWVEVIETCMVLRPALVEALPLLRGALDGLIEDREGLRLHITEADNGLDIALSGGLKPFETQDRLARTAEAAGWARLTHDEPVAVRGLPRLGLGKASVPLPQRAFLQPSEDGQAILQTLVLLAAIPDEVGLVLDLYSGHGTFALPLAERGHRVAAYEGAAPAIAALEAAAREAGFSGLTAATRDLNAWPVSGAALRDAGAVVIDPPRAGAKAQCEALAQDGPGTVVAVNCNPSTFARDARIRGGRRLRPRMGRAAGPVPVHRSRRIGRTLLPLGPGSAYIRRMSGVLCPCGAGCAGRRACPFPTLSLEETMSNNFDNDPISYRRAGDVAVDAGLRTFFRSVYNYMIAGLALTGIVGYGGVLRVPGRLGLGRAALRFALPLGGDAGALGVALIFGGRIYTMRPASAQMVFWAFATLMGVSLSYIMAFAVSSVGAQQLVNATGYTGPTVLKAFLSAALGFGVLSIMGYTTKRDLSGIGAIAFAGLIAAIIASLTQMVLGAVFNIGFFQGGAFDIIISLVIIAASLGLIAFTTQNLKGLYYHARQSGDDDLAQSYAIGGALSLYINFINLFWRCCGFSRTQLMLGFIGSIRFWALDSGAQFFCLKSPVSCG